eukprot:s2781_g3.t1
MYGKIHIKSSTETHILSTQVTYSVLLPVELADNALEQMQSFSQQPQTFQALLASALQFLGVSTSSLQMQSFEAPMMQVVMKSDESQAENTSSDLSDAVPNVRRLSSLSANDTDDSEVNTTVTLTTTWTMWMAPDVPNVTYGVGNMTRCGNGFYMTIYDMAASVSDVRYDGLDPKLRMAHGSGLWRGGEPVAFPQPFRLFPSPMAPPWQDLDPEELGGNVSWLPPNLTERVKVYRVYLAESAFPLSAAERYWISPEVEEFLR